MSNVQTRNAAATATQKSRPDFAEARVGHATGTPTLEYEVKRGDTLSKIARNFGLSVDTLFAFNAHRMPDENSLQIGQTLELPTTFYVVKSGDTYSKIAREFGMDYQELMALNGAKSDKLKVGQELRVPTVRPSAELAPLRKQLKALVEDAAKAEQTLYFGKTDSVTSHEFGSELGFSGPYESGVGFQFSNDLKSVKVLNHAEDSSAAAVTIDDADDFRALLISDVMAGLLNARALKHDEKHKKLAGQYNVLEGPVLEKNGTIRFSVDEPLCNDARLVYNPKNGKLTYTSSATGEPQVIDAGRNPSEVGVALAKLLKVKLPIYG